MSCQLVLSSVLLITLLAQPLASAPVKVSEKPPQQRGHLQTSAGSSGLRRVKEKEKHITERVKDEIKAAAKKFVQGSEKVLKLPLEIDVLLVGFDGDGSYGYRLEADKLQELLTQLVGQEPLCPHVWDTGESSMLCYEVNFLITVEPAAEETLSKLEAALKTNMQLVGNRSEEWADGNSQTKVYSVEASAMEEVLKTALDQSVYGLAITEGHEPEFDEHGNELRPRKMGASGGKAWHEARPAIILLNPHKRRMNPDPAANPGGRAVIQRHFIDEWKSGRVDQQALKDEEANYIYRYRYQGKGSAVTWLSRHNFLVVDIAAGPASFGPLASPAGEVHPVATPRLLPLLTRLAREIESKPAGTQHARALEWVAQGEQNTVLGALASLLASATQHVLAPDIRSERLEFAARVVVPVIIMQDHNHFDLLDYMMNPGKAVDMVEVQEALDSLLAPGQEGMASSSRHWTHQHPLIAAALHRARSTMCSAVLRTPPEAGLHTQQHVHVDSAALFEELRHAADYLVQAMMQDMDDPYGPPILSALGEERSLLAGIRHDGLRVLPVFVFSLREAPENMLMDNRQLVAAGQDAVVVLQLLGKSDEDYTQGPAEKKSQRSNSTHDGGGGTYTGHMQEGKHVLMDASESPTRSIVAGLAGALAGLVPPYQRYDVHEGRIVEDWRWGVGAQPWGPYSNTTGVSELLAIAAQRNMIFSHVEFALRRVHEQLGRMDSFVAQHLQGPFGDLALRLPPMRQRVLQRANQARARGAAAGGEPPEGEGDPAFPKIRLVTPLNPHRHWLNLLASRSTAYSVSSGVDVSEGAAVPLTRDVVQRLESAVDMVESVLEELSYALYTQEWDTATATVARLLREAEAFTSVVDVDLAHANKVLACCKLHHLPTTYTEVFVVIGFIFLCLAFVGLMVLGCTKQARQNSFTRRERDAALPSWVMPKQGASRYRV